MVYSMDLSYDEIVDTLDVNYIAGSINGYTLPPGIYEITDISLMLKSSLPNKAKVKTTIDETKIKFNHH